MDFSPKNIYFELSSCICEQLSDGLIGGNFNCGKGGALYPIQLHLDRRADCLQYIILFSCKAILLC